MENLDIIIFSTFLGINLLVGLFSSKGVTNISQYAVGDRNFSTTTLVATIVASFLGAGFFSYTLAETYRQGLYFILPALGDSLGLVLIGSVFMKRMGEFLGKLSIAEAMGDIFGDRVKIITALIGIILSIGALGVQFKVAAKILELVFGTSGFYATLLSAGIIILYSTFGGIKAVTFTDIIQFFTFSLIIPIIVTVVYKSIGDSSIVFNAVSTNPSFDFGSVLDLGNPKFYEMLALSIVFLPTFSPMVFQRIAMSGSIDQAAKSFKIAGYICLVIQFLIVSIAVFLLSENPNLNPNDLVTHIINHYSYPGFKAVVAIGIMAMIMSTADSLINAMAVIFAHDLCKPLGFKWADDELKVSKIFAVISGLVAIFFALKFSSILQLILLAFGLYASVVSLPFVLAIFGFRSSEKSVLVGMIAGGIAFFLWELKWFGISSSLDSCAPGLFSNAIFLFGSHYLLKQPGGWIGIKDKQSFEAYEKPRRKKRQKLIDAVLNFNLTEFCERNLPEDLITYHKIGFITGALVMANAFSIPFLRKYQMFDSQMLLVVSSIAWSIAAFMIVFPIMLERYNVEKIAPFFWTFGAFGALNCAPSIYLIVSDFAPTQLVVFALSALTVLLLFRWATALVMIGSGLYLSVFFLQGYFVMETNMQMQGSLAIIMLSSIVLAIVKPKEAAYEIREKRYARIDDDSKYMSEEIHSLRIMKQELVNNINHEIRTPIHHIGAGAEALYKDLDKYSHDQIKEFASTIYHGYQNAKKYVDNFLDFSNLSVNRKKLEFAQKNLVSIAEKTVDEFKELHGQNSDLQIKVCSLESSIFVNCDEHKIQKVITSLLENAIFYAPKSPIEITLKTIVMKSGQELVQFSMRDFGIGVPEDELVSIFGAFVQSSKTKKISGGKGIGLALCEKIISLHGGQIWAENNHDSKGATFSFVLPLN